MEYVAQLNDKEKVAMHIAKRMLGDAFNVTQCIGYTTYIKNASHASCVKKTSPPPS